MELLVSAWELHWLAFQSVRFAWNSRIYRLHQLVQLVYLPGLVNKQIAAGHATFVPICQYYLFPSLLSPPNYTVLKGRSLYIWLPVALSITRLQFCQSDFCGCLWLHFTLLFALAFWGCALVVKDNPCMIFFLVFHEKLILKTILPCSPYIQFSRENIFNWFLPLLDLLLEL